jgi:hypothetical protein
VIDHEGTKSVVDASIRDPDLSVTRSGQSTPTEVSDLGYQLYSSQARELRSSQIDRSPGDLYRKLDDAMHEVPGLHGERFCPITEIRRLVNVDSVAEELERSLTPRIQPRSREQSSSSKSTFLRVPYPAEIRRTAVLEGLRDWAKGTIPHNREKIARKICGLNTGKTPRAGDDNTPSFQRIFAALVLLEKPLKIRRFLKERVSDRDLPLIAREIDGSYRFFRRKDDQKHLTCFRGWRQKVKIRFEIMQWRVMAPYFVRGHGKRPVRHFTLHQKVILPFTSRMRIGNGASGDIFKVAIHEGHHDFDLPKVSFLTIG